MLANLFEGLLLKLNNIKKNSLTKIIIFFLTHYDLQIIK